MVDWQCNFWSILKYDIYQALEIVLRGFFYCIKTKHINN